MGKSITLSGHFTVEVDSEELRQLLQQTAVVATTESDEDFEDKPTKKPAAKKKPVGDFDEDEATDEAATTEEDSTEDSEDESTDEDVDDEPPTSKKSKKLTVEDVNDACKRKVHALIDKGVAGAEARSRVLGILQKKFKVKSISSLKATQFADAIAAMK